MQLENFSQCGTGPWNLSGPRTSCISRAWHWMMQGMVQGPGISIDMLVLMIRQQLERLRLEAGEQGTAQNRNRNRNRKESQGLPSVAIVAWTRMAIPSCTRTSSSRASLAVARARSQRTCPTSSIELRCISCSGRFPQSSRRLPLTGSAVQPMCSTH